MTGKCVFVIGPESSGSMLIAKIVAEVLGVHEFGTWNAVGWSNSDLPLGEVSPATTKRAIELGENRVCHRSLPYIKADLFPDIDSWIQSNSGSQIYFILTTRDVSIVDQSKYRRFGRSREVCWQNRHRSKEVLTRLLSSDQRTFIWSYETFIYLQETYLKLLYNFLGIESDFIPELVNGNRKYLRDEELGFGNQKPMSNRLMRKIRGLLSHIATRRKNENSGRSLRTPARPIR